MSRVLHRLAAFTNLFISLIHRRYFSPAVATTTSRQTFAKNIVAVYKQYSLDGIDIDWEYPGQQGAGSNQVSPQDSANFLAFLKVLRTSLPSGARITAAVQDVPFADASGNPMKDVSAFASVLDWVNLMNYDVWGGASFSFLLFNSAYTQCFLSYSFENAGPKRPSQRRLWQFDSASNERGCGRQSMDDCEVPRQQACPWRTSVWLPQPVEQDNS